MRNITVNVKGPKGEGAYPALVPEHVARALNLYHGQTVCWDTFGAILHRNLADLQAEMQQSEAPS